MAEPAHTNEAPVLMACENALGMTQIIALHTLDELE
jgi:hypothetical protein